MRAQLAVLFGCHLSAVFTQKSQIWSGSVPPAINAVGPANLLLSFHRLTLTDRGSRAHRTGGRMHHSDCPAPLRHLATATAPQWLFRQWNQWVAPLRHLVTQRRHLDPCANSRGDAPATPGPGRRSRGRGSNFGSRAWHASGLGWRPCWPLCNQTPNSKIGDGGYAGQDEIT